jgi:hypothetical protein
MPAYGRKCHGLKCYGLKLNGTVLNATVLNATVLNATVLKCYSYIKFRGGPPGFTVGLYSWFDRGTANAYSFGSRRG